MKRLALLALLAAAPLHAQSAGTTGAQVLEFDPGARAAALAGAYSTAHPDADALFYNPAGIAGAHHGASAAYESWAVDVAYGSLAGFMRVGAFALGASIAYLDAGDIQEVVPNSDFGGNTGTATGKTVSASESAARLSIAAPLQNGRLRLGASVGFVSSAVADASQNAPIADVGAQYDVGSLSLAVSARNIGGTLSGASKDALPTELRAGVRAPFRIGERFGTNIFAEGIARVRESSFDVAAGVEAGLMPKNSDIEAVARIGIDTEAHQLGALRFGAGVALRGVSLDYAYQSFSMIGAVHRLGLRWSVR